jgi:hypothetical protein
VRLCALVGGWRIEKLTLDRPNSPGDIAVTHIAAAVQLLSDCLQEPTPCPLSGKPDIELTSPNDRV